MNRHARLDHLQRLFYQNPRGYRSAELARLCDVTQRTISRDLLDLQGDPFYLPLVQDADWRWRLMEEHRYTLPPIRLSLQEAAVLYLAAQLLHRASDEPNPFIGRALLALARALPPEVGARIAQVASMRLGDDTSPFARVFAMVALGWATRRQVRVRHWSAGSDQVRDFVLHPYAIQLSTVGYAAYVVGYASYADAVRTLKLERIQEAELLREPFTIPPIFDEARLFDDAWGVMYGDTPMEVALRFSPQVAWRVRETRWHRSQVLEACADGGCILRVQVAHPVEMKPWIRGWGPDCVVLAPEELRREIMTEARATAERYGWVVSPLSLTDRDADAFQKGKSV